MVDKINAITYTRAYSGQAKINGREKKKLGNLRISKNTILLIVMALLLGRASILGGLAPFGIAFYISLIMKDRKYGYLGFFVLFGNITVAENANISKYCIALALSFMIFSYIRSKIRFHIFSIATISSLTMFLSGLIYILATDFYMYDLFMEGFEALVVFVFVYILSYAIPVVIQKTNRKILSNEELICVAILAAVVVSGLSNVVVAGYKIENVFGILLTLIFAYNGGPSVGASVGITIGIITSMSSIGTPIVISIYGFSGLLAGIFKDLGKIGSAIGMILGNAILTFYINGSTEVLIQFEEIITSFVIFMVMPKGMMQHMEKFLNFNDLQSDKTYSNRIQKIAYHRLKEYAQAFSQLAVTYGNIAEKNKMVDQNDIANMIDEVADKVCHNCGMCRSCWHNNFYGTYNDVVDVITCLENYGRMESNKIPNNLKKRCIKLDTLIRMINDRFEVYKIHYEWQKKLFESRQLIAEQFEEVSNIIDDLSKEINMKVDFRTEVEDALYVAFDKEGIAIEQVTVLEMESGKFEIEIEKRSCFDRKQCDEKIAPIVSKTIGREVVRKNQHCKTDEKKGMCLFTFVEAKKYKVATGVARISKDDRGICGDSYSFIELLDGQYMMALSDGMGSGERAAKESQTTVSILEQLMEAGFKKDIAIKTINSILVSKSSEETFSTMDLSMIDMYTGKVEFVKIGAASSFIKRANGEIEVIRSTSLPIGILNNIDIESFGQRLNKDDCVIIMSDGVLDADQNIEEKEKWVTDTLKKLNSKNPQGIADKLLDIAIEKYGNKIADDMTVMVSKIWESR
ncbi:stage II sporulation protein E [Marinisporobacter balticus]|uniref:Stage II sporulation protein E n=1 Tax=Marinisporobacter balticus TaxID=2018667 RepID=A0A4R2KGE5_9FIRM|nr:stage II sporulation protein E [Marinisporobacter balticus]TCO71357.1 stage II sporulation protein E [Marinisporobacter balticus]